MLKIGTNTIQDIYLGTDKVDMIYLGTDLVYTSSKEVYSRGLEYELSSDQSYYKVKSIGTCTDSDIIIPTVYRGKLVKVIGDSAFLGTNITSISIPESITSIEDSAFYWCGSLLEIVIPNSVTDLGNRVFYECALQNITLSNKLINIGAEAFYKCDYLTEITLPDSVKNIYSSAFANCSNLSKVNYTGTINQWAQIQFTDTLANPIFYSRNLYINNELVTVANITETTVINKHAFAVCESLTSIILSNTVINVNDYAFSGCKNVVNISIGNQVKSIGSDAFSNCRSLPSLYIPKNVKYLGKSVLQATIALKSVTFEKPDIWYRTKDLANWENKTKGLESDFSDPVANVKYFNTTYTDQYFFHVPASRNLEYTLNSDKQSYSLSGIGTCIDIDIVMPYEYDRLPITAIADKAFWDSTTINTLTISKHVTSIGQYAFYGSTLQYIDIPNNIQSIRYQAFGNCKYLQYAILSDNTNTLEDSIFEDSTGLQYIKLSANLTTIPSYTFARCKNLVSVMLPDSFTTIGTYAFSYCTALNNLILPATLTQIKNNGLGNCTNLTNIYYKGTPQQWLNIIIDSNNNGTLSHVTIYYYSESQPTDTNNQYWHYDINNNPILW